MAERINVFYVIWSLQTGGAERVVADLARGLPRDRFRPVVCCLNFKGRLAEEIEREGVTVHSLGKKPRFDPGALLRLARLMRRERADVVHTHLWTSSFWGRLAAVLARAPVRIVTEHNIDTWRKGWHFAADRQLARVTDHFVFVSREVEAFYRERLALDPGRGTVVLNGVDLAPFDAAVDRDVVRKKAGLPPSAVVAGVVGRLDERKGHRFFLEAVAGLAEREPVLHGLVVGEGRERAALEARHGALGLGGRLRILGYWPNLAEALAAIDVFVLPSLMEGHPLAILEAMAAGKPVVATRVGGNPEAVEDGVTGLLVPPSDPEALGRAILALARDPARARQMGREGRRRVEEKFSLVAARQANEEVYLRHYGRKRPGGSDGE
jgi:sugar transferase (PEP-CTERM/EpsH1 system associated)